MNVIDRRTLVNCLYRFVGAQEKFTEETSFCWWFIIDSGKQIICSYYLLFYQRKLWDENNNDNNNMMHFFKGTRTNVKENSSCSY